MCKEQTKTINKLENGVQEELYAHVVLYEAEEKKKYVLIFNIAFWW